MSDPIVGRIEFGPGRILKHDQVIPRVTARGCEQAMVQIGTNLAVGCGEPLPLVGFPEGKMRIRQRKMKVVEIFVRAPDGSVYQYYVGEKDGVWYPAICRGKNSRK